MVLDSTSVDCPVCSGVPDCRVRRGPELSELLLRQMVDHSERVGCHLPCVGEDQGDKECRPGPFVSLYLAGYEPHEGFVGPVFELYPGLYRWGGFPCVELACFDDLFRRCETGKDQNLTRTIN